MGFNLRATGSADQVMAEAYDKIHTQTMVPYAHLDLEFRLDRRSAGAVDRVQKYLRKAARMSGGQMPSGARHFGLAKSSLSRARALLTSRAISSRASARMSARLSIARIQAAIASLKIEVSDLASRPS